MSTLFDLLKEQADKAKRVGGVGVEKWEAEWRSTFKHFAPHCRARKQDTGEFCQYKRKPDSLFCGVHADDKWQYCAAITKRGVRCHNRPYKDFLCVQHLLDKNKGKAAQIKQNLLAIGDTQKLR